MHLLNTLVAVIISSVVISTAPALNLGVAIKQFKDSKEAITHEPITAQPAGGPPFTVHPKRQRPRQIS